jgi:hypothetical protein
LSSINVYKYYFYLVLKSTEEVKVSAIYHTVSHIGSVAQW